MDKIAGAKRGLLGQKAQTVCAYVSAHTCMFVKKNPQFLKTTSTDGTDIVMYLFSSKGHTEHCNYTTLQQLRQITTESTF